MTDLDLNKMRYFIISMLKVYNILYAQNKVMMTLYNLYTYKIGKYLSRKKKDII